MPPITSPRRQPFHAPAARGGAIAIPGAQALAGSPSPSFGSTPPSTGTSPGSFGRNGHGHLSAMAGLPGMHSTPYMVALAGWPEPVFVAERSRATTPPDVRDGVALKPQLEPLSREVRDGAPMPVPMPLPMPMPPATTGMPKSQPIRPLSGSFVDSASRSTGSRSTSRSNSNSPGPPTFPTSSARDSPLDTGNGTPPGSGLRSTPTSNANTNVRPRPRSAVPVHGFQDPRYSLNAGVLGRRTLRVTPAWTSASATHGQGPYTSNGDTTHHLAPRVVVGGGPKRPTPPSSANDMPPPPPPPPRIARAVPEVVPLPGPNSPYTSTGSGTASPASSPAPVQPKSASPEAMDVDK